MFSRLSSKLVAAFVLVIFLCLLLAGTSFIFLLRNYQTRVALDRLADLSIPVSLQVRMLERAGVPPDQMQYQLKDQAESLDARILVVNQDAQVVADTGGSLVGQRIQRPDQQFSASLRPALFGTYTDAAQQTFYLVSTPSLDLRERGFATAYPSSAYTAILAVPQQSVTATWLELAPSLSIAAAISLLVSVVVALFLSRSISGPLAQITRASEAMAAGNYDQTIDVRGRDEVGRLASTFNAMAREVANSHRTLRDFFADVSHELKTPLTSIRGFSQAMVDGTLKEPADYVDAGRIINEEAERMRHLVEDLLYLSKVESGQESLERQELDLADLLRACIRHWRPQADQARVQITLDAGEGGSITGDMHRLEQVFDNLIFNAINHTPPNGRITVHSQDLKDGGTLRPESAAEATVISIHNTGSTIPPQELPRVFERFYQVGGSAARDARGTGLGLAIVKEIVEAHGGKVGVSSSPDSGTKFVVTLPRNLIPREHGMSVPLTNATDPSGTGS